MNAPILYWQVYGCGCLSHLLTNPAKLPNKCPVHEYDWIERYQSTLLLNSVAQFDINQTKNDIKHQNNVIARYPEPTQ